LEERAKNLISILTLEEKGHIDVYQSDASRGWALKISTVE